MRSSHYLLLGDLPKDELTAFDDFVMFVRDNLRELQYSQPPCFVQFDKVKSLSWYLVVLSRENDDAFHALYKYILSNDENILRSKYENDPEILYYCQRDAHLVHAIKTATEKFPQTKLFIQKSAKPLQTFKQIVLKLHSERKHRYTI